MVFREALEDIAAMKLCASRHGKQAVVDAMEAVIGDIRFDRCPTTAEQMLAVRAAVDALL
jgi:DNA-binding FadR family transcriptional regulator